MAWAFSARSETCSSAGLGATVFDANMATKFFDRFPDLSPVLEISGKATGQLGGLVAAFGGDGTPGAGGSPAAGAPAAAGASSPVTSVVSVLGDLEGKLNIDLSGISTTLPSVIQTIRESLPPDTLEYVEAIEDAYNSAQEFVATNPLARQVTEGRSLQDVALLVIQDTLNLFDVRLTDLAGNLIAPDTLDEVRTALAAMDQFRLDFPAHQSDFLPFVAQQLVGVAPDLLSAPLAHVDTAYALFAPLGQAALAGSLDPAGSQVATAFRALLSSIDTLDPADANAYVQIEAHLGEVETASKALAAALMPLYAQLRAAVESYAWDALFSTVQSLLDAVPAPDVAFLDDIVANMSGVLNEILARLFMVFGPDDIAQGVEVLSQGIRDTVLTSPIGQVGPVVHDFLDEVRQAIEDVPTEQIQTTVEDMLGRVKEELDSLGIEHIGQTIEDAFNEVEAFITDRINDALTSDVRVAMQGLLRDVQTLPVADLITELGTLVNELAGLIQEIGAALDARMDDLRAFLSQAEQLSFKPISDEVIEEIDSVKARLQSINPDALSETEKLALRAALAVLESLELETKVVKELKKDFRLAENEVKSLLSDLTSILERLRDRLGQYRPDSVLGPVNAALQQLTALVDRLNAGILLNPLYGQVDKLVQRAETLSPGQLLDKLQGPYAEMVGVVERLDPAKWTAPLKTLYQQIDAAIALVDVTPVLDELDRQQRALFARIQKAITDALTHLNLPEPLNSFFVGLQPIVTALTDAIFDAPDTEVQAISLELSSQFNVGSIFAPLDAAFDQLVAMLAGVPQAAVVDTLNALRQGLGVALTALDPAAIVAALRTGEAQLVDLAPLTVLGMPLALPSLKLAFEAKAAVAPPSQQGAVAAVSARFDATFALFDPDAAASQTQALVEAYEAAFAALDRRLSQLDTSGVAASYARVYDGLARLVPDFLRQPEPLTYADILAGIQSLRPSTRAAGLEQVVERFLQRLKPLEADLAAAINRLFGTLRDVFTLVHPLSLRDDIADIYDVIRQKIRILDPDRLAEAIRADVFDPLTAPIKALDPAVLKARLDQVYQRVLQDLSSKVKAILDDIARVLDEQFRAIRNAVKDVVTQVEQAVEALVAQVQDVLNQVEQLVFVDILGRLNRVIDQLGVSFDQELDRVRSAFDAMIAAIPLGGSNASAT